MNAVKFFQSLFFTFIFWQLIFFFPFSCSSAQPVPEKKIGIIINSGQEQLYDVPVTLTFQTGDTVSFRAVVPAPYVFNGFSGYLTGTENPQTKIITSPGTITINYNIALAYELSILNSEYTSNSTFEFDVVIRSFTEEFILTAYQVVLTANSEWRGGKALTFEYINGTSDFSSVPSASVEWNPETRRFTFASFPGEDEVNILPKRIGRFKVTVQDSFVFVPVGLNFWFDEAGMGTIITGDNFTNITEFGTFLPLEEKHKVTIVIK